MIAAIIVAKTITYFQADNIFWPVMMFNNPSIICITGIWNAIPVAKIRIATKSKYWLKDQKGSTTSAP